MVALNWEEKDYETGVDRGVFFPNKGPAEVWNGLVSVDESPADIQERIVYRDGQRIVNQKAEDSFSASIVAFQCPESIFEKRSLFGMSYRTKTDKSYNIHLVYNAFAGTPKKTYAYNAVTSIAFDISTKPIAIPEAKPTAHLIIDASMAYPSTLETFENVLYGNATENPRLPLPLEVLDIFDANALYQVTDNGDGTFTLEAPDEVFEWFGDTLFRATWPSVVYLDEDTYVLRNG